jgi:flagellar basal-body rod protein FlgB
MRMDSTHIGLLDLAERRLAWVDQRQSVLAQNIANANTPGYQPHDLRPFAETLAGATGVTLARTQPYHLSGTTGGQSPTETVDRQNARSPDGNAVSLDDQLVKLADADTVNQLATTIYKKYLDMFTTALDRGSSS